MAADVIALSVISNFTDGYLKAASIFLGSALRRRLAKDGVDSHVRLRAGEIDTDARIQPTNQLSGMTEVIKELGLRPGDQVGLDWTNDGDDSWLELRRIEREDSNRPSTDDDIVNFGADAFLGDRKLAVVSVVDGRPGEKGGVNTASHLILRALDQAGHRVLAATTDPSSIGRLDDIEYVMVGSTKLDEFLSSDGGANQEEAPWIIGHGGWTGPIARNIADDRGISRLHVVHTSPTHIASARGGVEQGSKALDKITAESALIRSSQLCAMVGNSSFDFGHVAPEKSVPLNFQMSPRPFGEDGQIHLPPRYPGVNVLILGRLDDSKVKGLDVAVGVLELSHSYRTADQASLFFTASGLATGSSLAELNASIDAASSRFVEFPVLTQAQVADQVAKSSVVILPSGADAFGLVALEALAIGRPCIVSHLAGIAQLYRDAGFGQWVVDSNNPADWLAKIKEIVHTPSDLRRSIESSQQLFADINEIAGRSLRELAERMMMSAAGEVVSEEPPEDPPADSGATELP